VPERKLGKNVISRSVATRNLISKQKLKDFSLSAVVAYGYYGEVGSVEMTKRWVFG